MRLPDVQMRANTDGGNDPGAVHAAAARGTATMASPLPYADTIQRAFGQHDVSSVQAHTGGEAAASARDMGADAYATGNHVVLGKGTDLATVAHEAAHVVQQRGGIQLKGGVGKEGDPHERHADEVASLVVQGKSAEGLLDQYAGAGNGTQAAGTGPIQHKLSIGQVDQPNVEALWGQIAGNPKLEGIQDQAKQLLTQWIESKAQEKDPTKVSSNRSYADLDQLVAALAGEIGSAKNLAREGELAQQTLSEDYINIVLGVIFAKVKAYQEQNSASLPGGANAGRYGNWTYKSSPMSEAIQKDPGELKARISIITDYALAVRQDIPKEQHDVRMDAEQAAGRPTARGVTNANEGSTWVQESRKNNMPVSAGPSATTALVLSFSQILGCSVDEKTALAWALFALWNGMPLHQSGTHRFHEVMDVAANYGVPYKKFTYSDPPQAKKASL